MSDGNQSAGRPLVRLESLDALVWTLRVGAFLCFVGHGAFGIIGKPSWIPYFAVAGIHAEAARHLMPVIGVWDIAMGLLMLLTPRPAVAAWMLAWAIWTALLRPLAGEPFWEAFERAGNYGIPAVMILIASTWSDAREFFAPIRFREPTPSLLRRTRRLLAVFVAFLLVGHGALGLIGKPLLATNYASITPAAVAAKLTPILGAFEISLGITVLIWPTVSLALFIVAWKLATEALFLSARASIWEFVERGGSYAVPIALAIIARVEGWGSRVEGCGVRGEG